MTDEEHMKEIIDAIGKARKIYRDGMAAINDVMLEALLNRINKINDDSSAEEIYQKFYDENIKC